jgi:hypothetical protein
VFARVQLLCVQLLFLSYSNAFMCLLTSVHLCLLCRLASARPSAAAAAAAAAAAPPSDDAAALSFQWMGKIVERLVALYSHAPWQVGHVYCSIVYVCMRELSIVLVANLKQQLSQIAQGPQDCGTPGGTVQPCTLAGGLLHGVCMCLCCMCELWRVLKV